MKRVYRSVSLILLLTMLVGLMSPMHVLATDTLENEMVPVMLEPSQAIEVTEESVSDETDIDVPIDTTEDISELEVGETLLTEQPADDAGTEEGAATSTEESEVVEEQEEDGDVLQATKRYYHIDVLTQGTYNYNFSYSGKFVSTADINITKAWDDAGDNDGIRPDSVQVNVYQNGSVYKTVTLTADGGWKYSLNNIPAVDASGNKLIYTAKEAAVPEGYTSTVSVETIADDAASSNYATYTKNGYSIVFGFGDKAPSVVVEGKAVTFTGNTASISGGTWTYNPTSQTYSFVGKETMVVDKLNYVTYTDYLGTTKTISGTNYSPKWDSGHQNQEFFLSASLRQSLHLTPESTIIVNYTYSYSYVDEFGHTHTFNNITTSQTFDDPESDNVCSKRNYTDSQAGYDVRLYNTHATSDTFIENQGTEYNVTVTNTHEIETVSVTAEKLWNHKDNNAANHPAQIVLHISNNQGHMGPAYKKTLTAAEDWKATWTDLPKYVDGVLQQYIVWEEDIPNYTGSYTLNSTDNEGNRKIVITNTYDPDYTTVSVRKHWDDNGNQDGKRPDTLTVTLQYSLDEGKTWVDVQDVVLRATATGEGTGSWAYVWSSLPTKISNTPVDYRVIEKNAPEGYKLVSAVPDEDVEGLWHITNQHKPESTDITVKKEWVGAYGNFIPDSVTVTLYADGVSTGKTAVIEKADNWTYTFTDLDVYKNGKKIVYSVEETPVNGFASEVEEIDDSGVITVTNTLETVSITAEKIWKDELGQTIAWPEGVNELTFYLHANGENLYDYYMESDPERAANYKKTIQREDFTSGDIKVSWTGLASVYGDTPIAYTVWESLVTDYSVDYKLVSTDADGNRVVSITNTYDPAHTEVAVSKVWEDAYDQDGLRPQVIEVKLFADGVLKETAYLAQDAGTYTYDGKTVTVTTGSWTHIWTELDIRADGEDIVYTVEETAVDGYDTGKTSYVYDKAENLWKITNYHTPETVSLTVNKVWETFGNEVTLPEVEISLLADGAVIKTITVGADDNWTHTFENLPKYKVVDGIGGNEIKYEVAEKPVVGFDPPVYTTEADGSITVTNTLDTVYLIVRKVWDDENNYDGFRPGEITVNLLADGAVVDTVIVGAGNWHRFDNLPKYNAAGKVIEYTVEETPVAHYEAPEYAYNSAGNYVAITNTHVPLETQVKVTKIWSDLDDRDQARPESLEVQLYQDGAPYGEPVTLNEENGWTYTFEDLKRYDGYGELFHYEVKELQVEGYQQLSYVHTASEDHATQDIRITNGYMPPLEISVTKKWEDDNNRDALRPDSVTVYLLADGEKIREAVLAQDNNWTVLFDKLYFNNKDGEKIVYTVEEAAVADYTPVVSGNAADGFVITNTHNIKTTTVEVVKKWVDNNDAKGKRPDSITVQLYANGEKYLAPVTIQADKDGVWSYIYDKLPLNEDGVAIVYTVREVGVKHYFTKYSTDDGALVITNIYTDIPMTGDTFNMIFWSAMVLGAGAALGGVSILSFRRRRLTR